MYAISRVRHDSLAPQKYYWHPGGKNGFSGWRKVCNGARKYFSPIPALCYYEIAHAKAMVTRRGWKDNNLYTYAIEKVI